MGPKKLKWVTMHNDACGLQRTASSRPTSRDKYTVSEKCLYFVLGAYYNFVIHQSILTIFGRNVTENVSNQMMLYFPPHVISASALPEKE